MRRTNSSPRKQRPSPRACEGRRAAALRRAAPPAARLRPRSARWKAAALAVRPRSVRTARFAPPECSRSAV
eukprot:6979875-Prymnesium_polylepis.1